MTSRNGHIFAFVLLMLFFALQNIGAVAYNLRGLPPARYPVDMVTHYLILFLAALVGGYCLRRTARANSAKIQPHAAASRIQTIALCALLLLPAVISPVAQELERQGNGIALLDRVQVPLWAVFFPICIHFFQTRVPLRLHMLLYGIVVGSGHIWWTLLAPLVGPALAGDPEMASVAARHYQLMLNLIRTLLVVGIVFALWQLMRNPLYYPAQRARHFSKVLTCGLINASAAPVLMEEEKRHKIFANTTPFFLFLLPLGVLFFMNGAMGSIFTMRLQPHSPYSWLMHLILALFFIALGYFLHTRRGAPLKLVVCIAFLVFSASPLLLLLPYSSASYQALYLLFSVAYQSLGYCGMLIGMAHAINSKNPFFASCAVWFLSAMNIPGALFVRFALPHLPFSQFEVLCACSLLCMVLFPLLRKAFPLPEVPEEELEANSTAYAKSGVTAQEKAAASIAAFAVHYAFAPREIRILELLCAGASSEEMLETLGIKESSLRTYISHMLKKTGGNSRTELARRASAFQANAPFSHPSYDALTRNSSTPG